MTELKPCRFCGSEDLNGPYQNTISGVHAVCNNCACINKIGVKVLNFPDMKEKKLKEHREKVYQDFIKFHIPLKKD